MRSDAEETEPRRRRGRGRREGGRDETAESVGPAADGRDEETTAAQAPLPATGALAPAATLDASAAARAPEAVRAPAAAASAPAVQPSPEARNAEPSRIEPYVLPADRLGMLARDAGLEWIHSDADKVSAVQAAMAAEPRPVHVPRAPRPIVVADEGPLVLVETRKDLAQFRLPFDGAEHASAPH
ncbi:MAG TPA: hypothetical protein PLT38_12170 [Rubrivivax sp.]|nr:hypothetical protein [Rubrivivax sp.]